MSRPAIQATDLLNADFIAIPDRDDRFSRNAYPQPPPSSALSVGPTHVESGGVSGGRIFLLIVLLILVAGGGFGAYWFLKNPSSVSTSPLDLESIVIDGLSFTSVSTAVIYPFDNNTMFVTSRGAGASNSVANATISRFDVSTGRIDLLLDHYNASTVAWVQQDRCANLYLAVDSTGNFSVFNASCLSCGPVRSFATGQVVTSFKIIFSPSTQTTAIGWGGCGNANLTGNATTGHTYVLVATASALVKYDVSDFSNPTQVFSTAMTSPQSIAVVGSFAYVSTGSSVATVDLGTGTIKATLGGYTGVNFALTPYYNTSTLLGSLSGSPGGVATFSYAADGTLSSLGQMTTSPLAGARMAAIDFSGIAYLALPSTSSACGGVGLVNVATPASITQSTTVSLPKYDNDGVPDSLVVAVHGVNVYVFSTASTVYMYSSTGWTSS
eukprot:gnl/Spiro4/16100_TR8657_c0_g1_i1.p1 gnl/Spiro4/16100_TR8657_c0_g1~~gnl/Spiro4/16100_TR8657_c0_g1_i1.p1  ORF type:complete len:440 (+),score=67.02 gnl/Spiro4/16100_TR8657_c0_g1_i1:54-1373(+)